MTIVRWEPFGGLLSFRSFIPELGDLLPKVRMIPSMDVYAEGEDLLIKMEVPEMKPDDIDIAFNDGYIVVTGHREHEETERKTEYYRKERFAGSFTREIPLPMDTAEADLQANLDNGVLEIRAKGAAREVAAAKRIPISAEHAVSGATGHSESGTSGPAATGEQSGRENVTVGTGKQQGD
ncbi:MAG: hypothetical protein A2W01_02935 [Candidatus Solincola sediminis]|uniref:SHSP domain-containing protein n=1 Tax=Candidatus Solincola sediminis TaxID=1797199 RepID=A0A1F2WM28_9ACTN|nr:MAG: hypothetical protein A2Y75_11720 [Candidatus Solincola sediminis]OFW58365.1 MAG: hypothetical protein A2W01_02935 [Candidatus Solincola sediminis]